MKYHVDTIIFDFDGVVVDTGPDVANAANYTLKLLGLAEIPPKVVASYIGGGAERLMRLCLKERTEELLQKAMPIFVKRYDDYPCIDTALYPDVKAVLDHYKTAGKRFGIATQKKEDVTQAILQGLDIKSYFEIVVGPDSVTHKKPHPEALLRVLEKTGTPPEKAMIIGDHPFDIQAGKAAGVYTCGVTYGYGTPEEVRAAKADVTIDRIIDMLDWFE